MKSRNAEYAKFAEENRLCHARPKWSLNGMLLKQQFASQELPNQNESVLVAGIDGFITPSYTYEVQHYR